MRFFLLSIFAVSGLLSAAHANPLTLCQDWQIDQCEWQGLTVNDDCECVPYSIDPAFMCQIWQVQDCAAAGMSTNADCACEPYITQEPGDLVPVDPGRICVPPQCLDDAYLNPLTCKCVKRAVPKPDIDEKWKKKETKALTDQIQVPGTVIPRGDRLLVAFEGGVVLITPDLVGEAVQVALRGGTIDDMQVFGPVMFLDE
jgi:hypothetical protein